MVYIKIASRRLRRNLIAALPARLFHFMLHGSAPGHARLRTIICTQGTGLAKEELISVGGKIKRSGHMGASVLTLDNELPIIAYTAAASRRCRIHPVVGNHIRVATPPYDLTKGQMAYRERTLGQGASSVSRGYGSGANPISEGGRNCCPQG
ncbi:hypothetical protein WBP07_01350 [Novosphingobium sp. BL-8A]